MRTGTRFRVVLTLVMLLLGMTGAGWFAWQRSLVMHEVKFGQIVGTSRYKIMPNLPYMPSYRAVISDPVIRITNSRDYPKPWTVRVPSQDHIYRMEVSQNERFVTVYSLHPPKMYRCYLYERPGRLRGYINLPSEDPSGGYFFPSEDGRAVLFYTPTDPDREVGVQRLFVR